MLTAGKQARKTEVLTWAALVFQVVFFFNITQALSGDEMLKVYMDQARILKLDRDVRKVIVGNADVADVTVADPRTIVLTGRSFGATNLVLLDAGGNAILDERIIVAIDEANTLRIYKQTDRSVLSCSPNCEQHADTSGSKANMSSSVASLVFTNPGDQASTSDKAPKTENKPTY